MQWFSQSLAFQLEKYAAEFKMQTYSTKFLLKRNARGPEMVNKKLSEMSLVLEMVVKGQFYEEVGSWDGGKGVWEWKPKNKFSPIIFKFTRSRFKASSFPFLTFD